MNRTVRLAVVGVLIAVLASALPHPTSASASTSRYTLRWGFNQATKYIRSDATRVVSYAALGYGWSITPSSAPNAAMSRTDGHPCSTSTSVSRFGKASFTVSPNRVTNGEAMQECRAKLSGPSGWSARALTPSSISNSYYVLSNERIPQIDNGGVFCVADCRYVEGRPANVWRLKPPAGSTTWRWCFKEEFPAIDTDADITRDPFIVEVICPHRINFTRPANRYENATFTVRASSSLGKSVTLESLTPAVCTVKSTNTLDRHTVESLSVSRRRTCELRASAAGGQYEASASATTSFYVRNRAEGVVCCDTPLPDGGDTTDDTVESDNPQDLLIDLPGSLMEYSSAELKGSATSGLPISWSVTGNCYIDAGRVVMRAFPQGPCDVTAAQGGQPGVWLAAVSSESRIEIICSEEYSCRPPIPPAPELSGTVSDSTPTWMRLGADETIKFAVDLLCADSTKVSATRCDAVSPSRFVGAYLVVDSVTINSFQVTPPAGYPQNRWSTLRTPSISDPRLVLKFQQATSASQKFSLTYSATVAYRQVQWSNFLGSYQETVTSKAVSYTGVQKSFGVVGVTG